MGDSAADPKPTQIPAINRGGGQWTETDPEETVENKLKRCNFVQAREEEEEVAAYKRWIGACETGGLALFSPSFLNYISGRHGKG